MSASNSRAQQEADELMLARMALAAYARGDRTPCNCAKCTARAAAAAAASISDGASLPGAAGAPPPGTSGLMGRSISAIDDVGLHNAGQNLCYLNALAQSHCHLRAFADDMVRELAAHTLRHGGRASPLDCCTCQVAGFLARYPAAPTVEASGLVDPAAARAEALALALTEALTRSGGGSDLNTMMEAPARRGCRRLISTCRIRNALHADALAAGGRRYAPQAMEDADEAHCDLAELVHKEAAAARRHDAGEGEPEVAVAVPGAAAPAASVGTGWSATASSRLLEPSTAPLDAAAALIANPAGMAVDGALPPTAAQEAEGGGDSGWECPVCTCINAIGAALCEACETPHDADAAALDGAVGVTGTAAATAAPGAPPAEAAAAAAAASPQPQRSAPAPVWPDFACCAAHRAFGFGFLSRRVCTKCGATAPGHVSQEVAYRIDYALLEQAIAELAEARAAPVRADGRRYIVLTAEDLPHVMARVGLWRALELEGQFAASDAGSRIPHAEGCAEVRKARDAVGGETIAACTAAGRSESETGAALVAAEARAVASAPHSASWFATRVPPVFTVAVDYPEAGMKGYQAKNVLLLFPPDINLVHVFPIAPPAGRLGAAADEAARLGAAAVVAAAEGAAAADAANTAAATAAAEAAAATTEYLRDRGLAFATGWVAEEVERGLRGAPPAVARTEVDARYRLRSVVCHVGAHYISLQRSAALGGWKVCDDDREVLVLPSWERAREACAGGRVTEARELAVPVAGVGLVRTGCEVQVPLLDLGRPWLPRVLYYEWRDPRAELRGHLDALLLRAVSSGAAAGDGGGGSVAGAGGGGITAPVPAPPHSTGAAGGAGALPAAADGTVTVADARQALETLRTLLFNRLVYCDPQRVAADCAAGATAAAAVERTRQFRLANPTLSAHFRCFPRIVQVLALLGYTAGGDGHYSLDHDSAHAWLLAAAVREVEAAAARLPLPTA